MRFHNFVDVLTTPFKWIKNYFLCLKYPFLKSRNVWTDKFLGYGHTEYDLIPEGWRKAFGKQFLKDMKKALKEDKMLKSFRFSQIKEKWGRLCLYNFGAGKATTKVIDKYEALSEEYCICCGKPVQYETRGWVEFLCEKCFYETEIKPMEKYRTPEQTKEYIEMCKINSEK